MELRKKFKELRVQKGWSQEYVANQIFVSPKTISSWECGHRQMDSDAIESLSKLYGYELQPEEKKEVSTAIISISNITKDPTLSLSARDYIGKNKVTLRVDITQKTKRAIRKVAEGKDISLDDAVEEALQYYLSHSEEENAIPKEDGHYHLSSSYYEKEMVFSREEGEILLQIYHRVAEKQGFDPDTSTVQEMVEDSSTLDTVLYHVEEFGNEHERFPRIEFLFKEEEMKVYDIINGWTIKEKPLNQVPLGVKDHRKYAIFSPDGRWMEDHLSKDEAIEWANANNDYA